MYEQYNTDHETELGKLRIERTYYNGNLDTVLVMVANRVIELPKHMAKQTSTTIIRKVMAIVKG